MRRTIGGVIFGAGYVAAMLLGLWAVVLDVGFLVENVGLLLALLSLVFFPITLSAVPIWAAATGWWDPLIVTVVATVVWWAGIALGASVVDGE